MPSPATTPIRHTAPIAYPRRDRLHVLAVLRALREARAAEVIGPLGVALVTQVALAEDDAGYRGPVAFSTAYLLTIIGARRRETLVAVRERCIAAGWLAYQYRSTRRAALYASAIPAADASDSSAGPAQSPDECPGDPSGIGPGEADESTTIGTGIRPVSADPTGPIPDTIIPSPIPIPDSQPPATARDPHPHPPDGALAAAGPKPGRGGDRPPPQADPDPERDPHWQAVLAAAHAGDGPWLTFRGASLRGEWIATLRALAHDPATARANCRRWSPNLPSHYAEQSELERQAAEALARDARQQRAQAAEDAQRSAQAAAALAAAAAARARLLAALCAGTPDARELSGAIDATANGRTALDLVRTGNAWGLHRLRAALGPSGRARGLLERALAEPATASAASPVAEGASA